MGGSEGGTLEDMKSSVEGVIVGVLMRSARGSARISDVSWVLNSAPGVHWEPR